jgi:hypothetical protein
VFLDHHEASELNQIEAAELPGVSERTFRRWCVRYDKAGEAGLLDRRLGGVSGKRVAVDRECEVEALYRTRYNGFTAKHFHEHLVRDHQFWWGYTWTKLFLRSKSLPVRAKLRGARRRKRPRRPIPGMMSHQDGSRHEWWAELDPIDLIVTMDDATSVIYSAFLLPEEGRPDVPGLAGGVWRARPAAEHPHGSREPSLLIAEAGDKVGRTRLAQVGRALAHLGVDHIAAYPPEARRRSERLFHTPQCRPMKEPGLAGITTVEAVDRFISTVYMRAHNARFAVQA